MPYPNPSLAKNKDKEVKQYFFCTQSNEFFTHLHEIWYKWDNNLQKYNKVIPFNIKEIISIESIIHWIIQDGYFDNNGRTQTTILCTESFTKIECNLLQEVLITFSIKSTLKVRNKHKNTYRIRISKKSIPILVNLVKDSIPSTYHYKIGVYLNCWAFLKLHYMLEQPKAIITI
ncbi:unnamed protein product (mitochondrion) [Jaminaea pallidilutea]